MDGSQEILPQRNNLQHRGRPGIGKIEEVTLVKLILLGPNLSACQLVVWDQLVKGLLVSQHESICMTVERLLEVLTVEHGRIHEYALTHGYMGG